MWLGVGVLNVWIPQHTEYQSQFCCTYLEVIDSYAYHTVCRRMDLNAQQRTSEGVPAMSNRLRGYLKIVSVVFDRLSHNLQSIVGSNIMLEQPKPVVELHEC